MLNLKRRNELNKLKKFSAKAFLFVVLFLVISHFVNSLYKDVVLSNSLGFRTERQFQAAKQDARILAIGDSHIKYSVHAEYLEDSFVVANSAENYIQTYYKLNSYFEDESQDVALIIMPIELHSFSSYGKDRFETIEFWEKYIEYYQLALRNNDLPRLFSFWSQGEFAYVGGFSEAMDLVRIQLGEQPKTKLINGYQPKNGNFGEFGKREELAALRADYHFKGSDPLDPELLDYFFKMLDLGRENNIQVVLVRFPVTPEYYSSAMKIPALEGHYEKLDSLLALNGYSTTPILDYHDVFWEGQDYFSDPDHLNEQGAIVITKMLKNDLEELNLLP